MSRYILIVEDEPTIRVLLQEILELDGHLTQGAENGLVALDCVGRSCPALVILDLMMPRFSGIELVPLLRARHPDLPLLILSASPNLSSIAHTLGVKAFMHKPFEVDGLLTTVDRLLEA